MCGKCKGIEQMIRLRPLEIKDAPYMLEWMHDPETRKYFQRDMGSTTAEEAERFCASAGEQGKPEEGGSLHFAIVDEADEYLGTISLKSISLQNRNAEYAISVRKCAQGSGAAAEATRLLLEKAFGEYGLHRVYLNVFSDNLRAIRFYEKCGFSYEGEFAEHICHEGKYQSLKWFGMVNRMT